MELLPDNALEKSPIVANCCMNRERNLVGSNGYDKELGFNPLDYLKTAIQQRGNARWLDLCCGTGIALIEAAKVAETDNLPLEIVGVDLAGLFLPFDSSRLRLLQATLRDWQPETCFDLITCVHGLHYIGDKLGLLASARSWLTDHGRFVASLDMANIKLGVGESSSRFIASELRRSGLHQSAIQQVVVRSDSFPRQSHHKDSKQTSKATVNASQIAPTISRSEREFAPIQRTVK